MKQILLLTLVLNTVSAGPLLNPILELKGWCQARCGLFSLGSLMYDADCNLDCIYWPPGATGFTCDCITSGNCCLYTGWIPHDCAQYESLGAGFDKDGRCTAVNQGNSCAWNYADPDCCDLALADGFGSINLQCPIDTTTSTSGDCCYHVGPTAQDCLSIESLGDERCTEISGGTACAWDYSDPECCNTAVTDGFNTAGVIC